MNILGRDISRYWRRLPEAPAYLGYFIKCFWIFKNPVQFITAYLTSNSIPGRMVEMRNGLKIHMSEHPHDTISIFVVFVRNDYGPIQSGASVIDIGANIGIFSLYAAQNKAARVFSYEPCSESFVILLNNIQANRLENTVFARQLAIVGRPLGKVRFPVRSSMYNAILTDTDTADEFEWVETASLKNIVSESGSIDLLKIDCEGAEYDIIFAGGENEYSRIHKLRLEYHRGKAEMLDTHLRLYGFVRRRAKSDTAQSGNVWYEKRTKQQAPPKT